MLKLVAAFATLSITTVGIGDASAQAQADSAPESTSYRNSLVKGDLIAAGLLGGAVVTAIPCVAGNGARVSCQVAIGLGVASVGTYLLASPITHLTRDRPKAAALALALRVGLPAGALAIAQTFENPGEASSLVIYGMIAAPIIDYLALGRFTKKTDVRAVVAPSKGGASFAVAGAW